MLHIPRVDLNTNQLPLQMFENTVVAIESEQNDGTAQLVMWNVLVRQHNTVNKFKSLFICCGTRFPSQSYNEFMSTISIKLHNENKSQLFHKRLKDRILSGLNVKEMSRLEEILDCLKRYQDILTNNDQDDKTEGNHTRGIIIQDIGHLFNFEVSKNYKQAHIILTKILMMLRKLAKLFQVTAILFENNKLHINKFESFKQQFYDYKVIFVNNGNEVSYSVEDYGHNFLGFLNSPDPKDLLKGKPLKVDSLFDII